jgi:outer membrane protein TolC
MARAGERPRAVAAQRRAAAAGHAAVAERRGGLLPSVVVSAGVSQRDRALQLVTPIGNFDFGDRRSESADLTVLQPVLRPAQQLFAAPAARAEADAAGAVAERVRQEAAARAAEAFLDVLAVDAAVASTDAFLASLEARLAETEARVAAGRTLEADALKVRLARDDARQDRRALLARREVALADLARAVGQGAATYSEGEEAVEPRWNGPPALPEPPAFTAALARALGSRPDLAALAGQRRAAELRRRGVRAERMPSLDASASYVWQGGSPYADDAWVEAGLRLTWRPLAAGTRAARGAALAEQAAALDADLAEARRGVELELRAAYADLDTARGALEVGESGVHQATETLRVETERYQAGRVTTNDLLDAEAALRRQRTRRDVAALDVVRAWVRVWTAMGEEVPGL